MTRVLAAAFAFAVAAVPLTLVTTSAGASSKAHHHPTIHVYPQRYDGNEPAEYYPNCLPWSPKLQTWVWVCGPPYPPDYPVAK
jgi:hypothetical protein